MKNITFWYDIALHLSNERMTAGAYFNEVQLGFWLLWMDASTFFMCSLMVMQWLVGWFVCYGYDMIEARVRFAWKRSG